MTTSAALAPSRSASAVSSSVSAISAVPVPGTNGTRPSIAAAAARITAIRSATVCEVGSPVDPPTEMPWVPLRELPLYERLDRVEVELSFVGERGDEGGDRAADGGWVGGERAGHGDASWSRAARQASYSGRRSSEIGYTPRIDSPARTRSMRPRLALLLIEGAAGDVVGERGGHDDDALAVADDDVAGHDEHARTRNRNVDVERDVAVPQRCGVGRAEVRRDLERGDAGCVADAAVGHDAGAAAGQHPGGEDVADRAGAGLAPGLHDDDVARR